MLRQVIAGILLSLHIISFVFVHKPDEQDCYVAAGKIVDQSGPCESDFYLYSSYISFKEPMTSVTAGNHNLYKEERYSYRCSNIISPPPERTTI